MKKILVIDDEKPTLAMLRLFLEACGYVVFVAADAEEGFEIFKNENPPIVLTDIKMPRKDGFAVIRQIKAFRPETEVIVITGHGDKDLAQRAFDLEACAFLNKPLNMEILDSTLKRAEEKLGLQGTGGGNDKS